MIGLSAVIGVIRMFDWGTLYFGGNHIDGNFWAHAFYTDGLVFLLTWQALVLYVYTGVFIAGTVIILKHLNLSLF